MNKTEKKAQLRLRRKKRIRKKIFGTEDRPRLTIYRSSEHVYAQVIDDNKGATLASIHSFKSGKRANREVCKELGAKLAAKCKSSNITKVIFDKNGYAYHGRVQALAEGAREGGLEF